MRFLSVCSGIEAASVAWHPLGWQAAAYSEIEPFPSAVLAHYYPQVPNRGDMTKFKDWPDADVDLLVGGTPCQSFSVAGLRKGLDDPRGSLMLTYLAIARRYRPRWLVWENVPGVLSADGGRAFGSLLGGLAGLGYGFAYRILDAQYFRLAQRRRRVFVVGHLGDWRRAAAVLFERESLSGHPAPRREAGERVTGSLASRASAGGGLGTDLDCDGGIVLNERTNERTNLPAVSLCLNAGGMGRIDAESETLIPTGGSFDVAQPLRAGRQYSDIGDGSANVVVAQPLLGKGNSSHDATKETYIAHALRADGFDASEDGTGRGTPLVPIAFAQNQRGEVATSDTMGALKVGGGKPGQGYPAIAFSVKDHGADAGELAPTLRAGGHHKSHANAGVMPAIAFAGQAGGDRTASGAVSVEQSPTLRKSQIMDVMHRMQVRRLTPRECERLQGFPDDYTLIPYRGKLAADGPRYKALGNSMAVPVMRWIGERIALVDAIQREHVV